MTVLVLATGAHGTEPDFTFVANPLTGVALDGYDPVSYFTEPEPLPGRPDFDHLWAGRPWYFASAANRDAFIAAPTVYAPLFGGHGAMALARGYLSDGNPAIYLVHRDRLVLFYSIGNREAFALNPDRALVQALGHWERLRRPRESAMEPPTRGEVRFGPDAP